MILITKIILTIIAIALGSILLSFAKKKSRTKQAIIPILLVCILIVFLPDFFQKQLSVINSGPLLDTGGEMPLWYNIASLFICFVLGYFIFKPNKNKGNEG